MVDTPKFDPSVKTPSTPTAVVPAKPSVQPKPTFTQTVKAEIKKVESKVEAEIKPIEESVVSKLQKIQIVLKNHGMDTQQQEKAYKEIKLILGW